MSQRLSPVFTQLAQDALLKVFWYKESFKQFLLQHKIKMEIVALYGDQTKRAYLTWLWPQLLKDDKGHYVILSLARSIADMEHFPDLERHEDSKNKLTEAREAVRRLKAEVQKIDAKLNEDKDAARRRKEAQTRAEAQRQAALSIVKLQEELVALIPQQGTTPGGFAFEKWFYRLAIFFELHARPPYDGQDGRQIDGALTHGGTTFLVETKFTKEQIGVTHIDSFMAKINSKADNTMGILVSIAGFDAGAIKAASKERTPMLLVDHGHFFGLIFPGLMTLHQVIERIKRHASQTGEAYLSAEKFSG